MPVILIFLAATLAFLGEHTHDTTVFTYVSDAALILILKGSYELYKALADIREKEAKKVLVEAEKAAKKERLLAEKERLRAEADHQFEKDRRAAQARGQESLKSRKLVH